MPIEPLVRYMKDHSLSDQALAAKAGLSRYQVMRIRNGSRNATLKHAIKLSQATGIPPDAFLTETAA